MEMVHREVIVETDERITWHALTSEIEAALAETDLTTGLVLARTGHTSAAVTTNEAEERLLQDLLEAYTDLVPPEAWYFHDQVHIESDTQRNAFAHIITSLVRRPVVIPFVDGQLQLGGYEDVLFLELDGPRRRTVDLWTLS